MRAVIYEETNYGLQTHLEFNFFFKTLTSLLGSAWYTKSTPSPKIPQIITIISNMQSGRMVSFFPLKVGGWQVFLITVCERLS